MNEPRICPKCGTPHQWEMWPQCTCGYDFGVSRPQTPPTPQEPEPEGAEGPVVSRRINRFLWRLFFAAAIIHTIARPFHALHWLSSAAALVLALLLLAPMRLPGSK